MSKKLTRTNSNHHYARNNREAVARNGFCYRCAWSWLKINRPEVAEAIKKESFKRWPPKREINTFEAEKFAQTLHEKHA